MTAKLGSLAIHSQRSLARAIALTALLAAGLTPLAAEAPSEPARKPPVMVSGKLTQPELEETVTTAARVVIQDHCAACHRAPGFDVINQTGTGTPPKPTRAWSNADLEHLARNPRLVIPGLPDASPLYTRLAAGNMPPTGETQRKTGHLPTGDEIHNLREWIAKLPARNGAAGKGFDRPQLRKAARKRTRPGEALEIWTDNPNPKVGTEVRIFARSRKPCHLTLISIEADGDATVILPNDYQRTNFISGGEVLQVPPANTPFTLDFRAPGRELIVGICSETADNSDGIEHDFDRMRFTYLGPWSDFLRKNLGYRAALQRRTAKRNTRVHRFRERFKRRGRWKWRWRRKIVRTKPTHASVWPVPQVRTAITIDVAP